MSVTPYIGQVSCIGYNYAPEGWFPCDGRSLPIQQYETLFSLIGTTYGGDGQMTFNLPDLRGRAPIGVGQLSGGGSYVIGEVAGVENVTLLSQNFPAHSHSVRPSADNGDSNSPANTFLAAGQSIYNTTAPSATMNSIAITPSRGGQPHNNLQPYLTCFWVIAWNGIYPSQG
jgi:microcystin-dependent protein